MFGCTPSRSAMAVIVIALAAPRTAASTSSRRPPPLMGRPGCGAHSSALGSPATSGVSTPRTPILAAPAWRPQRRVTARQGVGEEGSVIA